MLLHIVVEGSYKEGMFYDILKVVEVDYVFLCIFGLGEVIVLNLLTFDVFLFSVNSISPSILLKIYWLLAIKLVLGVWDLVVFNSVVRF